MAPKRRKYEARFSANRIKKIMQKDDEVGKVSAAVPVMISRILELFLEGMLKRTQSITDGRNSRTFSAQHLKECIDMYDEYGFLRGLMASAVPTAVEDAGAAAATTCTAEAPPNQPSCSQDEPIPSSSLPPPSTSSSCSGKRTRDPKINSSSSNNNYKVKKPPDASCDLSVAGSARSDYLINSCTPSGSPKRKATTRKISRSQSVSSSRDSVIKKNPHFTSETGITASALAIPIKNERV